MDVPKIVVNSCLFGLVFFYSFH